MSLRRSIAGCAILAVIGAGFSTLLARAEDQVASLPPSTSTYDLIDSTVKAHTDGGEPLRADIQKIVCDKPENGADVATYLRTEDANLNKAQKDAIERGLAECLNYLGVVGFFPAAFGIGPLLGLGAGAAAVGTAAIVTATKPSTPPPAVSPN